MKATANEAFSPLGTSPLATGLSLHAETAFDWLCGSQEAVTQRRRERVVDEVLALTTIEASEVFEAPPPVVMKPKKGRSRGQVRQPRRKG